MGHIHIFCIIKYFPVIVYTGIEYWRIWSDVSLILVTVSRSVKGRRQIGSRCNRTFPYFTRKLTPDMPMTISTCLYHVYFYRSDYCCKHLYCLYHVYIFRSGYCNKHWYVYMTISTCLFHVYIYRSGYCNKHLFVYMTISTCLYHVYIYRSGYCNKHLYVYMTISTCLYHVYIYRSGYCNKHLYMHVAMNEVVH